jgi:hypothetical protein
MSLKDKILLIVIKVLCTIVCLLSTVLGIIGIIQDGGGINPYIICFNLYIIIKMWFKRIMLEDFLLIAAVEIFLAIRYMVVYTLEPSDIFVICICITPFISIANCYFREGYHVKHNNN